MAILIDFEMVRESETQVEYRFGFEEMDRLLMIDKSSLAGTPADGKRNPAFGAVFGKILRMQRERGNWPTRGMYAA